MLWVIDEVIAFAEPLGSPFLALGVVLALPVLRHHLPRVGLRSTVLCSLVVLYFVLHTLWARDPRNARWLTAVSSPLFALFLLVILPALRLENPRGRRWFLLWPAFLILLWGLAILRSYRGLAPGDLGFHGFLAPTFYTLAAIISLPILLQPLLQPQTLRLTVKTTALLLLLYGGFAARQSMGDYRAMLARRGRQQDIMQFTETVPVAGDYRAMLHLPSAPCRFSADGGYVQGCNLELLQRLMQVDYGAVARRDVDQTGPLNLALGSLTIFLFLSFLAGRWFCGWVCPLHSLGAALDGIRRRLRLAHLKLSPAVKRWTFRSGVIFASITLLMARLYPRLDETGRFAGCRIPLYPFCKICPGQQVCPVAAAGPSAYSGLPTWDWGFGFFRLALLGLLAFFVLSFALGRRWWCRLCPMGMLSGLFNRGGAIRLAKDARKCNRCGMCAEVCPMDIDGVLHEMRRGEVGCFDCVYCLRCIEICPRDRCLSLAYAGKNVLASQTKREP